MDRVSRFLLCLILASSWAFMPIGVEIGRIFDHGSLDHQGPSASVRNLYPGYRALREDHRCGGREFAAEAHLRCAPAAHCGGAWSDLSGDHCGPFGLFSASSAGVELRGQILLLQSVRLQV
jgi:hypothetical protein